MVDQSLKLQSAAAHTKVVRLGRNISDINNKPKIDSVVLRACILETIRDSVGSSKTGFDDSEQAQHGLL